MASEPVTPQTNAAFERIRRLAADIMGPNFVMSAGYLAFAPDITQDSDEEARKKIRAYINQNIQVLGEIRHLIADPRGPNWSMPADYLMFAQDIAHYPPIEALKKVQEYINRIRDNNLKQRSKYEDASKYKAELNANPITNAGSRGLTGYFWRQILATINATPLTSLNLFEVNGDGLQIFQPFATISRRVVRWRELKNNELTLSVNPPAYFDWLLGFLRQFSRNIVSPWGELVLYERGSGRDIARAVALWPDTKIKEIRAALERLSLADDRDANRRVEPRKVDLLTYYDVDDWALPNAPAPVDEVTKANVEQAIDEAEQDETDEDE